jgi:hypothetical protein
MNNGPLGGLMNPGLRAQGAQFGSSHRSDGIGHHVDPHRSAIKQYAAQAAHRLATAMGAISTKTAIGGLLGHESFSAGVAFGMVASLASTVYELGNLFKMFSLAEYADSQHSGSFWMRIERSMLLGPPGAPANASLMSLAHFWPGFDRQAKEAHEQREALFSMISYAFEHPGEVLKTIGDAQSRKYQEFKADLARQTMKGDFHAGVLAGELLLDVLMVIDGVATIGKIAAKIPRLLELLPKLRELAPALRAAMESAEVRESRFVDWAKPEVIQRGRVSSRLRLSGSAHRNTRVEIDATGGASNEATFVYRPTSGVRLDAQRGATTTILGSYNNDMKSILGELGNIKSTDFGPRVDGFNIMNVSDDLYVSPQQFWSQYNQPWLYNSIERGDNIVMATEPAFDILDVNTGSSVFIRPSMSGKIELSGFGREYLMLRRAGYVYQNGVMVK